MKLMEVEVDNPFLPLPEEKILRVSPEPFPKLPTFSGDPDKQQLYLFEKLLALSANHANDKVFFVILRLSIV